MSFVVSLPRRINKSNVPEPVFEFNICHLISSAEPLAKAPAESSVLVLFMIVPLDNVLNIIALLPIPLTPPPKVACVEKLGPDPELNIIPFKAELETDDEIIKLGVASEEVTKLKVLVPLVPKILFNLFLSKFTDEDINGPAAPLPV